MTGRIKILFVCHGNICRSTMAEYMFKNEIDKRGIEDNFEVDSCATSREEIGNPIYPPARRKLESVGVPVGNHRSRQMTMKDYEYFDHIYIMDENNRRNIMRIIGEDNLGKVRMILPDKSVADPWYTGNFEETFEDLTRGIGLILNDVNLKSSKDF